MDRNANGKFPEVKFWIQVLISPQLYDELF